MKYFYVTDYDRYYDKTVALCSIDIDPKPYVLANASTADAYVFG
jgi:hypothetical protein